jgi:hypothetical protein
MVTEPVLPGWGRLLVFVVGVILITALGFALAATVAAASLGGAFCIVGLLGLAVVLWAGVLLMRAGRRIVTRTGAVYERLEVMGKTLREVAPGTMKEIPLVLPSRMGVLDLPAAYSELHALEEQDAGSPTERAVDLVTGAIAELVARDDVVLARREYPMETKGLLARASSEQVTQPVLMRRRVYVGPGALEDRIAQVLRTDYPMTVDELLDRLVGPDEREGARRVIQWVDEALTEQPPDLEALGAPDQALQELQRFRVALRRADPELYQMMEEQIQNRLAARVQRSVPSSILDLARQATTVANSTRPSGSDT